MNSKKEKFIKFNETIINGKKRNVYKKNSLKSKTLYIKCNNEYKKIKNDNIKKNGGGILEILRLKSTSIEKIDINSLSIDELKIKLEKITEFEKTFLNIYDDFIKSILLYPYNDIDIFDSITTSFKEIDDDYSDLNRKIEKLKNDLESYKRRYLGLRTRALLNIVSGIKKSLFRKELENVSYQIHHKQNNQNIEREYSRIKKEIHNANNQNIPIDISISTRYEPPIIYYQYKDKFEDKFELQHVYICLYFFKYLLNDSKILENFIFDFIFSTDLIKYAEIYNQFPFFKYFLLYQFIYNTDILKKAIIDTIRKNNDLILKFYFKYMYTYTDYYIKEANNKDFNDYFNITLNINDEENFTRSYWQSISNEPLKEKNGSDRQDESREQVSPREYLKERFINGGNKNKSKLRK